MRIIILLLIATIHGFAQHSIEIKDYVDLKPFYHGVASGDPLADRVIIWTRVTPENENGKDLNVSWKVAQDVDMKNIVKSGNTTTNASKDYTVKVDVIGLEPGKTYYYQFEAMKTKSIIGRTKTTPNDQVEHLRFAVVSCSNYQAGFFNAYARIADRNDLDAVIHLGDYIYEYGDFGYGDSTLTASGKRKLDPTNEITTLDDYRKRYSLYRKDADLRAVHQQHPFIVVWDDHETANDAYKEGAQNHNEKGKDEGQWNTRKEIARQVYTEWLPIRGDANPLYRTISYGNLMDLILLDTRLEGRDKQIPDITNPDLYAENRTILGPEQREWLLNNLKASKAQWKVIGNQVIFAEFNVGWAAMALKGYTPEQLESVFLDIWDGYPAERTKIMQFIKENQIENTIFITGDVHVSFAYDIAERSSVFSQKDMLPDYDPSTGAGAFAVEFVTPSISSSNFDENIGAPQAKMLEYQINKPLPNNINPNPHLKYVDLTRNGYFILDLTKEKAEADWYFVDTVLSPSKKESFGEGWYTTDKANHLQKATQESSPKTIQDTPAPLPQGE
jgi:alkaline phosphatase D